MVDIATEERAPAGESTAEVPLVTRVGAVSLLIACGVYAAASSVLVAQMGWFAIRSTDVSALLGMLGLLVVRAGWSAAYAGILWWLARSVLRREYVSAAAAISGLLAVGHLPLTILTVTGQIGTGLWSTTVFFWLMAAFPLPAGIAFAVLAIESLARSKQDELPE